MEAALTTERTDHTKAPAVYPRPAPLLRPDLGPLGYVWDQLPIDRRAQWRDFVGLDEARVLGFEYAVGLAGIAGVIAIEPTNPPSKHVVRTHIRRHGLPIFRPAIGMGFAGCGKAISPLCQLLRWADLYLDRNLARGLTPLTREEVD